MKNKLFVVLVFFFGLLMCAPAVQAQKKTTVTYKTVTVKGKKYYKHTVIKGETLLGISKAYKVSVDEITRLNPSAKDGLRAGNSLIIPIKVKPKPKPKTDTEPKPNVEPKVDTISPPQEEGKIESDSKQDEVVPKGEGQLGRPNDTVTDNPNSTQKPKIDPNDKPKIRFNDKDYYLHDVKSGETLEEISQAYRISVDEIMLYNPDLKNGIRVGMVLGIPVQSTQDLKDESDKKQKAENDDPGNEVERQEVIEEPKETPKDLDKEEVIEREEEQSVVPLIEVNEKPESDPVVIPEVRTETPPVAPTPKSGQNNTKVSHGGYYTVQPKEDLYDIAKKFGVDLADLRAINEGLSDNPASGTVIEIPKIANENDYIVHYCERNERVTSLLKRWKVDENVFRAKNVSVGSHVFENQVVLIPIQPITDFYWMDEELETVVVEKIEEEEIVEEVEAPKPPVDVPQLNFDFEATDIPVCVANPANAQKRYHVALMVPLYLYDIDNLSISKERSKKTQKSRSMSFLQFYEGFMIAAETLEKQGLKLDLTVMDVTDNVSSAERALEQIRGKDFDLIVGPFFGRSFDVIEEYAKANGIVMVNPLSTRESVIENSPNVVKVKPGDIGMILSISSLVKNSYSNANVFIVSREKAADTIFLNQLEHHLNLAVNDEVTVSGDDFLNFARDESERLEMGSRLVPTLDVEGQVYSTDDFQNGSMDKVVMANSVKRYSYSEMGKLKSQLSGVRTNLIIAYGDDNVFATQILNSLTKSADRFPITLVCVSDWQKYEKLLVDNLLKMNAIYVSDFFVDYQDDDVKHFVRHFRSKYVSEPQNYAFEGYDVGYYFLNALMQYGNDDLIGCLHCYEASLLHTHYRFYYKNYLKSGDEYGKENLYWSLYQYDKENIELVPIDPFKKTSSNE